MSGPDDLGEDSTGGIGWLGQLRLAGQAGDTRAVLEDEILPDHLLKVRWYGAKDAGWPEVRIRRAIALPETAAGALLAVLQVTPPGRGPQLYALPLLVRREGAQRAIAEIEGGGALVDAFEDERFARGLVDLLLAGHDAGGIAFRGSSALSRHRDALAGERPALGGAEQSNTSVRFGRTAILKLFRRLEPGEHPELEMSRFLTEVAGFEGTPSLLGWLELVSGGEGAPVVLGVLQRLVPGAEDGWSHVRAALKARVEAGERTVDPAMLRLAERLGTRTGELHRSLAMPSDDPAMAPEPVTPEMLKAWHHGVRGMAEKALAGLEGTENQAARTLRARRDEILRRIDDLVPGETTALRTRHHGDFHLGQVLVANDDVAIIDFEGEPMRPLAERRGKHAPLRDVAGMLRSFAYAAATVEREAGLPARALDGWAADMSAAFLDAYRRVMADCPSLPRNPDETGRLLQLFLLEKALYEVGYELANRPAWLEIPVAGVLSLLDPDGQGGVRRAHAMSFGAAVLPDGQVRFNLWAPKQARVELELEGERLPMQRREDGWHTLLTDKAGPGSRYRFVLEDGGMRVPDPASRFQPDDVHGTSEVIDPGAYAWSDGAWRGRPWAETVLYEFHVGTFTPEGTYRAAMAKLDHLVELGVTAIELLPLGDFAGKRNWGYDGVYLFAPDSAYGRPEDLKALIDAAHGRGLMVFLDVIYNHYGPDGNYLGLLCPIYTERHKTPWGAAINYDGTSSHEVRAMVIHNALYWLEEYHFDGLRLDAVHAIVDDSEKHLLTELAERVRAHFPHDRHIHLVLENEHNEASRLVRHEGGRVPLFDAQWADDIHHGLHVAVTDESESYYEEFHGDVAKLGRALAEGFSYQGEPMGFRDGKGRGEPSGHLPPTAFVSFLQNHDQVGNRAFGDRIAALGSLEAVRAAAAVYLLAPQIPMLFMGEEWGTQQPFAFFCDFGPDLAEAVRKGRREEFAKFSAFSSPKARERIPDPTAESTFRLSKLPWDELAREPHAAWLAWYRSVLRTRRERIVPLIPGIPGHAGSYDVIGPSAVRVAWRLGDGRNLVLLANLAAEPVPEVERPEGQVVWHENAGGGQGLGPWEVLLAIAEPSALDRLADKMGIEASFASASGGTVRTSPATKRALLEAMGLDAADERAAKARLGELAAEERARPLPPALVVREHRLPAPVELTLPAGTETVRWRLVEEGGDTREGSVGFAGLGLASRFEGGEAAVETRAFLLPGPIAPGYHRLEVEAGAARAAMPLIVAPERCYLPEPIASGGRIWGVSVQLYTLRSAPDWGMGDFGDLQNLAALAAGRGAGVIGLNPLHAMFLDNPDHASPYSPASRLLLNVLYIDVTAIPELMACKAALERLASPDCKAEMERLRAEPLVDHRATAALKLPLLEEVHRAFLEAGSQERREAFAAFRREIGEPLERFCLFQALRERFAGQDPGMADWRRWPEDCRNLGPERLKALLDEHRERVEFLAWLQWIADTQLAAAAATAAERGMAVGLYRDLAVGADASGAETWANPGVVITSAQVGAPPDLFNPAGQGWGLPPFHPHRLKEEGYKSFIELVRANMRHAGGLRIDHVMMLQHLYWIPEGKSPAEGAYVAYPLDDLLGILALESQRQRCLVVGEDLGTVPPGFRERMAENGVLSYRVLFFEWDEDGSFKPPEAYPHLALATIGSHDLATLRGWWEGHDIHLKERCGLYPSAAEAESQRKRRRRDRRHFVTALRAAGFSLPTSFDADSEWNSAVESAAHAFLARTGSAIGMLQLDDLAGNRDQVNLPGTTDQYPNWRRKLAMTLEELADDVRACALMSIMSAARGFTPRVEAGGGQGAAEAAPGVPPADAAAALA
jgi:malto-oligosyltrehalose trehalohydrolase/4-alpha-glucanotransferase